MTSLKEAALDYAEKGWAAFPIRVDKKPYTSKGVMDATTNLNKIEVRWYNAHHRCREATLSSCYGSG